MATVVPCVFECCHMTCTVLVGASDNTKISSCDRSTVTSTGPVGSGPPCMLICCQMTSTGAVGIGGNITGKSMRATVAGTGLICSGALCMCCHMTSGIGDQIMGKYVRATVASTEPVGSGTPCMLICCHLTQTSRNWWQHNLKNL